MYKKRFGIMLALALLIILVAVGCSSETNDSSDSNDSNTNKDTSSSSPTSDGEKKVLRGAFPAEPETLDPQTTTATPTRDPARHIFETLVTLNADHQSTPMLAESYEQSEDGKTVTFNLREGVKFHNGKEMIAEDVVASMTKWGDSSIAKANLGEHSWESEDDYTVVLQVEEPTSVLMYVLAEVGQFPAIMPKEVIDSAGDTGVTEYIGTGPFKFEEWKPKQHILFSKFEDYSAVSEPASGLAGKKEVLVDEFYYEFVPDDSTRVAGLISGEYDYAHMMPYDAVPQIENTPGMVVDLWTMGLHTAIFNKKGIFGDVKLRQAVNYGMDNAAIMTAAYVDEQFYDLDPGFMMKDQTGWYTDAGKEMYNNVDLEKAKQLIEESDYNGEEIIILTSRDYAHIYNSSVATQQELEKMGIKSKLDIYDWATVLERRDKPEAYDLFYTGWPVSATPLQYLFLDSKAEWAGWTDNPEIDELLEEIKNAGSPEESKEIFTELQEVVWRDVPVINVGTNRRVSAHSENVEGYFEFVGPVLWNADIVE